ncbi:MAG TPA: FtsX-like permease family protein [Bryobacteraceae bacterium]|jgi:putative ABC transport system permease protein|nr:FtsX-like permease family protein [Bryobacteraceae bacterium]
MRKSISFRTAAKIAWRETRSSSGRFIFVILAVAAGVGSLTGVRGFSRAFHTMLQRDARTFMAADLTVRTFQLPTGPQTTEMKALAQRGIARTQVTETLTMASPPNGAAPILISVKAVDPAVYPFYGEVKLNPPQSLRSALQPDAVVVSDGVLLRLGARLGDTIRIGGQPFRIAAEVTNEPDRMTGSLNVGPRVMISRAGLARTGLLIAGSRAAERFLFKVPSSIPILTVRNELKSAFKEGLIADYSEAHPLIEQGLRQSTTFLSLVSLIALVIGALGVATAIQAHLQQKMDSIAIMKCLGARSAQVLRIYILQTLGLGLAGSFAGIALGSLVQMAFPVFLARYFQISMAPRFDIVSALQGLTVGLLTVLLFTVPPLLGIRDIRPALIFRREMAAPHADLSVWWKRVAASVISAVVILAFVGLIAVWLSENQRTGLYFAIAMAAGLTSLALVAWTLLRGLRWLSRHLPRSAGPVIRQGIANLYRPGNHAGAAVMALGVGVMFTVTVWIVQRGLLKDIVRTAPPGMPNVYLLDVTAASRDAVYKLISGQPGVEGTPEMVGAVAATIQSIDGVPFERENQRGVARRYARTVTVSPAAVKPAFTQVVAGKWWSSGDHTGSPQLSVAESAAKLLNLHVGSRVVWTTPQKTFSSTVAAIHKSEAVRLTARIEFFLTPEALAGLPAIYYGGLRASASSVPAIQKAVYDRFPTVTVVNMADVLDTIQSVVDQISLVVRFISAFSILAGAIILASSVAGTRFRRIREVVILKTLGATRRRIAQIFSIEFFVIGTVAGLMGGLLAGGFGWLVLNRLLTAETAPDSLPMLVSIAGTALLAIATGWLASFRTLGQKPLEILREE